MVLQALRRLARLLKHAPDRLAHDARRSAAIANLREAPSPRSILILCHGNVCRSPYAAVALRRRLKTTTRSISVESAGFIGANRAPPPEAIASASERGKELTSHRSQLLNKTLLDASELIVVMNPGQGRAVTVRQPETSRRVLVLGDLDPLPIATREIVDPWGKPQAVFDACYDRIDRCIENLIVSLAGP